VLQNPDLCHARPPSHTFSVKLSNKNILAVMREIKLVMTLVQPFLPLFLTTSLSIGQLTKQTRVECGQQEIRMTREDYLFKCGGQQRKLHPLIFELYGTVDMANDTTIGK